MKHPCEKGATKEDWINYYHNLVVEAQKKQDEWKNKEAAYQGTIDKLEKKLQDQSTAYHQENCQLRIALIDRCEAFKALERKLDAMEYQEKPAPKVLFIPGCNQNGDEIKVRWEVSIDYKEPKDDKDAIYEQKLKNALVAMNCGSTEAPDWRFDKFSPKRVIENYEAAKWEIIRDALKSDWGRAMWITFWTENINEKHQSGGKQ